MSAKYVQGEHIMALRRQVSDDESEGSAAAKRGFKAREEKSQLSLDLLSVVVEVSNAMMSWGMPALAIGEEGIPSYVQFL
jgi:hypothetical protein